MTDNASDIAHRFAAAFTARDVEELLDCFTADAVYHDLLYGRVSGRAGLQRMFERMYAEGEHHEWAMTQVVRDRASTIGEWRFVCTVSAAAPAGRGRTLSYPGVSVFETRTGRCHTYREYFDRGAVLLALGIRPDTVDRVIARLPSVEVAGPAWRVLPT